MSYFAAHFEEQLKLYKKQVSHISRPLVYARVCAWHIYRFLACTSLALSLMIACKLDVLAEALACEPCVTN